MIKIINGDLLDSDAQYIAHQTNCVSHMAAGVAKAIFDAHPHADVYSQRDNSHDPMKQWKTIKICGDDNERLVINMFSQFYPGSPGIHNNDFDSAKDRQNAFYICLNQIAKIPNLESIAFPYKIGCGLAGGDWSYYSGLLSNFERHVSKKFNTEVFLLKKDV